MKAKRSGLFLLALLTSAVLVLSVPAAGLGGVSDSDVPIPEDPQETYYHTIAGIDRYGTANYLALYHGNANRYADGVIIVTGENYPDALAVAGLAGLLDYPVLLTPSDTLDSPALLEDPGVPITSDPLWKRTHISVSEALAELAPKTVIVIGGQDAVGSEVEAQLKGQSGVESLIRLGGNDRYETAQAVYEYGRDEAGGWSDENALVISGVDFADGVSISAYAAYKAAPVFLADANGNLDEDSLEETGTFDNVFLIGGTGVVSAATEAALKDDTTPVSRMVTRLGGANRYETCRLVAAYTNAQPSDYVGDDPGEERLDREFSCYDVFVATGRNFPDALVAGITAGLSKDYGCPTLFLADEGEEGLSFLDYFEDESIIVRNIRFLGGDQVVTMNTRTAIMNSIGGVLVPTDGAGSASMDG